MNQKCTFEQLKPRDHKFRRQIQWMKIAMTYAVTRWKRTPFIRTTIEKVWVPVKLPKCLLDLGAAWNWLNLGQSTRWSRYRCFANMLEKHSCLPKMIYLRILSKIPYSFFLFAWILNFRQKWTQISVFSSQRYLAQLHGDHFQAWPKSKGLKTKTRFILDINMEILDTNAKLLEPWPCTKFWLPMRSKQLPACLYTGYYFWFIYGFERGSNMMICMPGGSESKLSRL